MMHYIFRTFALGLTLTISYQALATQPTPAAQPTPQQSSEQAGATTVQSSSASTQLPAPGAVVAEINGEKIAFGELQTALTTLPSQLQEVSIDKIYEPLLNRVIDTKLITRAAEAAGMRNDPDVQKKMQEASEAMLQKFYLDREISKLITDLILKGKYDEILKMMPKGEKAEKEIRLRHILVKTKKEAEEILKKLKGGADFAALTKQHSIDEPTKTNGGDLGYVRKSDMPKSFSEKVFKAAKATLIPEPLEVEGLGWSVIRVEDKRDVEPPSFQEVKEEIRQALVPEYAVQVIKGLRNTYKVVKYGLDGKVLLEKQETAAPAPAQTPTQAPSQSSATPPASTTPAS